MALNNLKNEKKNLVWLFHEPTDATIVTMEQTLFKLQYNDQNQ